MGKSIYEISDELRTLIDAIEENGGEIDEEVENKLAITQDELSTKIDDYCKAISIANTDIDFCKKEKQRINDIQNTKKNLVEKLKSRVLDAVNEFGYYGKSGNKVIDTETHKLFTKLTKSLNVDKERYAILCNYAIEYVEELDNNGILQSNEETDLNGMMGAINANIKATYGEDFVSFTTNDLSSCRYNMNFDINLLDLMRNPVFLEVFRVFQTAEPAEDTTLLKALLTEESNLNKESNFTIAKLDTNTSLTIK